MWEDCWCAPRGWWSSDNELLKSCVCFLRHLTPAWRLSFLLLQAWKEAFLMAWDVLVQKLYTNIARHQVSNNLCRIWTVRISDCCQRKTVFQSRRCHLAGIQGHYLCSRWKGKTRSWRDFLAVRRLHSTGLPSSPFNRGCIESQCGTRWKAWLALSYSIYRIFVLFKGWKVLWVFKDFKDLKAFVLSKGVGIFKCSRNSRYLCCSRFERCFGCSRI